MSDEANTPDIPNTQDTPAEALAPLPPQPSESPGSVDPYAPIAAPAQRGRRRVLVVTTAAVIAAAVFAFAFLGSAGGATALALAFSQGQTRSAHMDLGMKGNITISTNSAPLDVQASADVELKVTGVDADGTATIVETISNMQLTSAGQTVPSPPAPAPVTLKMTKDGRILTSTGATLISGAGAPTQLGTSNLSAILPDGPVKPGDTWTKVTHQTMLNNKLSFSTNSTYLRDENVGSVNAAVIETKGTVPMDLTVKLADIGSISGVDPSTIPPDAAMSYKGQMSIDTTSWIDPGAKQVLKTEATVPFSLSIAISGLPAASQAPSEMKMSGTMTMTMTYP
jgi:hypothetical protein